MYRKKSHSVHPATATRGATKVTFCKKMKKVVDPLPKKKPFLLGKGQKNTCFARATFQQNTPKTPIC
jgi:hypothetical protein